MTGPLKTAENHSISILPVLFFVPFAFFREGGFSFLLRKNCASHFSVRQYNDFRLNGKRSNAHVVM